MQEQIKRKNNVFNRFSCGQLIVADVPSPFSFFPLFGRLSKFVLAMNRACVHVCVIAAVSRGRITGNEATICQLSCSSLFTVLTGDA